jgi:hypothetical protein
MRGGPATAHAHGKASRNERPSTAAMHGVDTARMLYADQTGQWRGWLCQWRVGRSASGPQREAGLTSADRRNGQPAPSCDHCRFGSRNRTCRSDCQPAVEFLAACVGAWVWLGHLSSGELPQSRTPSAWAAAREEFRACCHLPSFAHVVPFLGSRSTSRSFMAVVDVDSAKDSLDDTLSCPSVCFSS